MELITDNIIINVFHRLRNSTVTEAIMTSVANETGRYPFQLETVEILSGTDETVYIWMAANWLLDSLSEVSDEPKT